MTAAPSTGVARRTPADKHEERRRALAESALQTLGELGYARASLREIAQNSAFSHGVVHYYFRDKLDLIVFCVRQYKATCVRRYDAVVEEAATAEELLDGFADKLAQTIVEEAAMHRLWYDLRSQAMFEDGLREAVLQIDRTLEEMVWRVLERYAALAGAAPALTPATAYAVLDGVFQQALLGYLTGREGALDDLVAQVRRLVPVLLAS